MRKLMTALLLVTVILAMAACGTADQNFFQILATTTNQIEATQPQATTEPLYTSNTLETAVISPELTWKLLSQETDKYKLILTLLGEHFKSRVYTDSDFQELSQEEKILVADLFDYANKNNALPTDFSDTFTAFCIGNEFENMFFEGMPNSTFYTSLSISFVISWKSDGSYYIDIKENKVTALIGPYSRSS